MPARKSRPVLYEMIRDAQRGKARSLAQLPPSRPVEEAAPAPAAREDGPPAQQRTARASVAVVSPTALGPSREPELQFPVSLESGEVPSGHSPEGAPAAAWGAPLDASFDAAPALFEWRVSRAPSLRVALAAGWPGITIVAAGVFCLLCVAYFAGAASQRGSAAAPAMDQDAELNAALLQPATPTKLAPERSAPASPAAPPQRTAVDEPPKAQPVEPLPAPAKAEELPTPQVALHRGYFYLVVQHFPKNKRQSAEEAARYLSEAQIPCALHIGKDIRLIATERFDLGAKDSAARRDQQQRVDALKRRVRDVGKKYVDRGYAFDNCYVFEAK